MKNLITLFFLLTVFSFSIAQEDIILQGLVVEQNSKFNTGRINYLSNVQVKSSGAQPQLSDANGKFTLIFADKPVGNSVQVFATKKDFEIVNIEELKNTPVLGRKTPFKIVMCKAGQLYENQMTYYNIAKDAALELYQKRLDLLQQEGQKKEELIAQLQVEFNEQVTTVSQANELLLIQLQRAEAQAKSLANKWVAINLDDQSESYKLAFKAFMSKDIEGALKILEEINFDKRLSVNAESLEKEEAIIDEKKEIIAKQKMELEQDINQCLFKAELYVLKNEFEKAEEQYELAQKFDPKNTSLLINYAYFLEDQNKFNKAIQKYNEAIAEYTKLVSSNPNNKNYKAQMAGLQRYFGGLLLDVNDLEGAEKNLKESLSIFQQLDKEEPELYLESIGHIYNSFGSLYRVTNKMDLALENFNRSLEISKKLAETDPNLYFNVAASLTNLGNLYANTSEYSLAKKSLKEAIDIFKRFAQQTNDDYYSAQVANALTSLAITMLKNKEYPDAEKVSRESIAVYEEIMKENPAAYSKNYARALLNFGAILKDNNKHTQGIEIMEKALSIQKKLAEEDPEAYNMDICYTLVGMGQLYEQMINLEENTGFRQRGLAALKEARIRLAKYPDDHPTIISYWGELNRLISFFSENNDHEDLLISNLDTIKALKIILEDQTEISEKISIQSEVLQRYAYIIGNLSGDSIFYDKVVNELSALSWYLILDKQFEEAEQTAREAIGLDPYQENKRNLSLVAVARLYQGKIEEAKFVYINLKDIVYGSTNYRQVFLEDLDYLESKGIYHPDVKIIRELLKE